MPIIDKKNQHNGRVALVMLKKTGTIALYNDNAVYCFECMFKTHRHELEKFWSLDKDDITESEKVYTCDECGKEIS